MPATHCAKEGLERRASARQNWSRELSDARRTTPHEVAQPRSASAGPIYLATCGNTFNPEGDGRSGGIKNGLGFGPPRYESSFSTDFRVRYISLDSRAKNPGVFRR